MIGDLLTDDGAQGELIDEIDEAKPVSQPVGDEAEEAQEAGGE